MEENIKKLEYLLSKDFISKEEQNIIKDLISSNLEAKKFYSHYVNVRNIVKVSSHYSEEEIGEYILRNEGNLEANDLSESKVVKIEEHLRECDKCSAKYLELTKEYPEVSNFLEKNYGYVNSQRQQGIKKYFFQSDKILRYSFTSVLSTAALYVLLMIISLITTPETTKLANIEDVAVNYITRGRATDEFQKGVAALDNDDLRKAVAYFNADAEKNKKDVTVFYAHYIIGLTYLKLSEKDFIGLFPSYDKNEVNLAIESLERCINENTTGNFPDISSNAYFYMAKAELMLDNKTSAQKYLQKVVELKGSKLENAKEILKLLE